MAVRQVVAFEELRKTDVGSVGGKNASLGEMISQLSASGVRVPGGFATTADAYREFLAHQGLAAKIEARLKSLDVGDVKALAAAGKEIRQWLIEQPLPAALDAAVRSAYAAMEQQSGGPIGVAVRSSATAEDLPDASFAGQQETFLNIVGIDNVLHAMREVFASLYNDRAISYRVHKGFTHAEVALSAGVQRMVRSDKGSAGVMFTLDTESGFPDVVFITSSYGLGECVVQGSVNPDEFYVHKQTLEMGNPSIIRRTIGSKLIKMVFGAKAEVGKSTVTVDVTHAERDKFSINDADVLELARYALIIEKHYGHPMDIEWGKDGVDGKIYILQARPETVKSQAKSDKQQRFVLKGTGEILVTGRAIGQKIGTGRVRIVADATEMDQVQAGDVLVTDMTDPNWEPVMQRAAGIVTNRGGRTCHAAIIARELGIPAVVGCGDATDILKDGMEVTVCCAEGDTGNIYKGALETEITETVRGAMPKISVKIGMIIGNPALAFDFAQLPNDGVALARLEFIINSYIAAHPRAILDYPKVPDDLRKAIDSLARGYINPRSFFVEKMAEGVSTIAAAFWPKPVIVRLSDFKSNEYKKLIGGALYEPDEENPMLGFRGAARYTAPDFAECFRMECEAMKKVRDEMGFTNVEIMIPFVRTLTECGKVIDLLRSHGLERGKGALTPDGKGLRLIMMCELPANVILAEQYLEYFDGFSIGSNDLTQLTLGLDRDSGLVAGSFDERDPAVKALLKMAIAACKKQGKYVGICGQGPSDYPDFANWLRDEGIVALGLNPDTVVDTWNKLAAPA